MTRPIRREMKPRAAVEPVIGHTKAEHRMGRNYLKGRDGDRSNAVLAAAGYNFSLLLRWLRAFARPYTGTISGGIKPPNRLKTRRFRFFTDDKLIPKVGLGYRLITSRARV